MLNTPKEDVTKKENLINSPVKSEKLEGKSRKIYNKNIPEGKVNICFPVTKQSGQEFYQKEDILAHLEGEAKGMYIIGRNGMWHSGIHIIDTTTPWCALSSKSASEVLRAVHNPSYRNVVQKTIVKHPSDWYHKKEDSIWQAFLKPLKKQAPDWEKYSEAFIEKMAWMQEVTTEKLGPVLWHMHPVMFLGILKSHHYWFDIEKFVLNYKGMHSREFGFYEK